MSVNKVRSPKERKSWAESYPTVKNIEHFVEIVKHGKFYDIPDSVDAEDKKALIAFANFLSKRDSSRDMSKSGKLIEQVRVLKSENAKLLEGLNIDSLKTKFSHKKVSTGAKAINAALSAKILRQTSGKPTNK